MPLSAHNPIIIGGGVGGLSIGTLLVKDGFAVRIFEKSSKLGGRTASIEFRNHILDNGFHIMPFYKKSAIYDVLKSADIDSKLKLAIVDKISFFDGNFHRYPKGIGDILKMSIMPLKSRFSLLKILLPIAFTSMEKAEQLDQVPLTEVTKKLDIHSKMFFDAVCMLAFADTADHISLGEFARTIIRANPFKGGTSEFAYPDMGGYDRISQVMGNYIQENNSEINIETPIKKILVKNSCVTGVLLSDGEIIESDCVIVSYPAYHAINQLFDDGVFDDDFIKHTNRLNKTTSVVEVHFALSKQIDTRQVVFPVGDNYTSKGIFFISNITPSVSPKGEHLIIVGTPVKPGETDNPSRIREIVSDMKKELSEIYPEFDNALLWERPMAWKLVESVVKEPGLVWKNKMPHSVQEVKGLFFVGDSTVSYGIGTDSAAHSAILAHPKIVSFLKSTN
ncbi:MAG: FAD-dependent oxidoreductase [Candidatus Nitrosopelagicus sp.]|jgi:protoporphyrinogen oxidase|nr:FAD-dependent oxidoreductase [Candidatus Nitrosopelagicus sp.]